MLFAIKWEKIQKRKEKQSLVCLGWKHLVFLRASSIIEKFTRNIQRCCWHSPGVTALQLTLQPDLALFPSVMNTRLTMLLLLVMLGGRKELILWPPITMLPLEEEPQLFSIKVVPSPSVIVRWSSQLESHNVWMSNAVNCKERINPCSTCIVSVFSRLFG